MHFTSEVVAVDIDCWQRTVAEQLVGLLASVGACNESVLPLVEGEQEVVHRAVDSHKIGRSESRLGVVVHS
jgi:hypothetical protein